ncbi:hypothetical protein ACN2XU_17495 [Primorskyibacter sp. 2E107]|uniref:hypothetical protein n=1 Tax=Primorskyibacter sp. 2E107 TaxID=3403458 RepID=UPI003AF6F341
MNIRASASGGLGCNDRRDIGCGLRFSESFLDLGLPPGGHAGIDVHKALVAFLQTAVDEPRFADHHGNASNAINNKTGEAMTPRTALPFSGPMFDLMPMVPVIPDRNPNAAGDSLAFSRRIIRDGGPLFFSAFVQDDAEQVRQRVPENPGPKPGYAAHGMSDLLTEACWRIVSRDNCRS